MKKSCVWWADFDSWSETVPQLLEQTGLIAALAGQRRVLIKPNLVEILPPPITTPVGIVEALIIYIKDKVPGLEIVVGEGCGAKDYETARCFQELGYADMASRQAVRLVDLNGEEQLRRSLPQCKKWPEMYLPKIVYDSFLLSVPVLKAHSLAGVTLTMKNMMGCAPPAHFQQGGHWKKAAFHADIHDSILDLNRYRHADFTLLDATVGMAEAHLWGPTCSPPVAKLVASFDPVAIDAFGCELLGRDWRKIGHIKQADKELGNIDSAIKQCKIKG